MANGHGGKRPGSGIKKGQQFARTRAKLRAYERVLKAVDITAERTMLEIARVAITDRRGVWHPDGRLKPLDEWTADQAAALEGLEVIIKNAQAGDGHTDTIHKVKLTSKLGALQLLAQHFGLVSNKLQVSGTISLADAILGANAPPEK